MKFRRFMVACESGGGAGGGAGGGEGGGGSGGGAGGGQGGGAGGAGGGADPLAVVQKLIDQVLTQGQVGGQVREELTGKVEALNKSMADLASARDAEVKRREQIEQDLEMERATRRADLIRSTLGLTDDRVVRLAAQELGDKADVEKIRAWGLDAKNATLMGKATPASVVKDVLKVEDERLIGLIVKDLGADARDPEKVKAWAKDEKNAPLLPRAPGRTTPHVPAPGGGGLTTRARERLEAIIADPKASDSQRMMAEKHLALGWGSAS